MARTEKMDVCFLLLLRKDSYGELHPFLTPQISWVLYCRLKAFHPEPPWHCAIPTTTPPTRLSFQQSPDYSPRLCPGDPGGQTQRLSLSCIPRPEFLSQIGVLFFFVLSVCTPKPHLESPSAVPPQPCFSSKSQLGIRAVGVSAESGPRHLCSVLTYILQLISRSGLCWQIEGVSQMSPGPKERIAARISRNTRELLGELIN